MGWIPEWGSLWMVHPFALVPQDEKEIRETTPFTIVTNNIKYLGTTLTKEVKDLYDKNFKSLKKETALPQKMERSPMLMGWQD